MALLTIDQADPEMAYTSRRLQTVNEKQLQIYYSISKMYAHHLPILE